MLRIEDDNQGAAPNPPTIAPMAIDSAIDISYRNIFRITTPVAVTQLSYTAMGVIDTMMVGRLGVLEVGAVGLGTMLTWWFQSFFWGTLVGVNTFVAQEFGARGGRRVGVVYWQGLYLAFAFGIAISAVLPFVDTVFGWTGASPEMQAIAVEYATIRLWGGLGLTLLAVSDNFYRGLGRTDIPMWCTLGQVAFDAFANWLLIFGHWGFPAMGVRGAAWTTVFSQSLVGVVLFCSILGSRRLRRAFEVHRTWRPDPAVLRSILWVSLPIGVQTFVEMGGISVFAALIARLGAAEMAATNTVIQVWSLAFMICFSLAVASTTLVGQCLGARQHGEVRRVVARCQRAGFLLMLAASALYLGAPEWLMALFVHGAEAVPVIDLARPLLLVVVISLFFDLRFNVLAGAMRGAGATTYPMVVNIACAWLLFVPLTVWAVPRWGVVGAWWCLAVYVVVMAALLEVRYRGRTWMRVLVEAGAPGGAPEPAATGAERRVEVGVAETLI
jgi:MATE family multidrug resistance protein